MKFINSFSKGFLVAVFSVAPAPPNIALNPSPKYAPRLKYYSGIWAAMIFLKGLRIRARMAKYIPPLNKSFGSFGLHGGDIFGGGAVVASTP